MTGFLLILHAVTGGVALVSGLCVLIARKGTRFHVMAGRWFYYNMLVVAISALALSFLNPNLFLGIIGVFTLYMTVSGQRMIRVLKKISAFNAWDRTLSGFMMLFALALFFLGVRLLMRGDTFGVVNIVFAVVSVLFVVADLRLYRASKLSAGSLTATHLQRMTGSYIAALTAFLVVNLPQDLIPPQLNFIPWLLPSAVLVPFIIKWSRKYGRVRSPSPEAVTGQYDRT